MTWMIVHAEDGVPWVFKENGREKGNICDYLKLSFCDAFKT